MRQQASLFKIDQARVRKQVTGINSNGGRLVFRHFNIGKLVVISSSWTISLDTFERIEVRIDNFRLYHTEVPCMQLSVSLFDTYMYYNVQIKYVWIVGD
ncbi:unnamed protein product [Acanthoscelides obtectus]|uniref:Uncharacterized protein n=1 Tax=Acanthoscelides obtectus TaxID=200917 RepID=A0A9P0KH35_ACAOB|nr:unnamed protein product [Acanthoscelides obtectus]CAK1642576.1 hypothetical protein AOBTE_LOCUS13122 [Acanthoscelides obtectus]